MANDRLLSTDYGVSLDTPEPFSLGGDKVPTIKSFGEPLSEIGAEEIDREVKQDSFLGDHRFPADLGQAHIPDEIAFFFVDLITKDGASFVTGSGKDMAGFSYKKTVNEATSKSSNSSPVNSTKKNIATEVIHAGGVAVVKTGSAIQGVLSSGGMVDQAFDSAGKLIQKVGEEIVELSIPGTYAETGDIVRLMMPSSIEFNDGAGWQAVNSTPTMMGTLASIALTDASFEQVAKHEIVNFVTSMLMENGGAVAESTTKRTLNPYTSQAFESMARRQFRFSWVLTPKNAMELETVHSIIKLFRFHMHPLMEADEYFLRYPSQVDIEFHASGALNEWLPKLARCVIKDFNVNYTPNNQWATVNATKDGAPYQYQLSVTVEEVVPLTKADVRKGY